MIAAYALGVWADRASTVMVRGYYALGDWAMPVRIATVIVVLNLALNFVLIWPLAEAGLGVSTAISAAVEVLTLAVIFSRCKAPLGWRSLAAAACGGRPGRRSSWPWPPARHCTGSPPAAGLVNSSPACLRAAGPRRSNLLQSLSAFRRQGTADAAARRKGKGVRTTLVPSSTELP